MKIQIVIPTINLWTKYTKQCVESVKEAMIRAKAHSYDSHILLIDNASTDETRFAATSMENELFHYQRNEERWGFQKSVNFGVKYGFDNGADYVLICNNDITIHPEALWRLGDRLQKGDVGMATCMDVRGEMQKDGVVPAAIGTINAKDKESCEEAPHPNFSAFMIDKDCWNFAGEFDEVFAPAYFEDNDFHYRMKLLNIPSIVFPPAMFYHYGSRTQNEAAENGQPMVPGGAFENARAEFVKKWGGGPTEEKFQTPYNDKAKSIKSTKQNPNA